MEPIGNICYAYPMDTSTGKKVMEGRMTSIYCRIDATMTSTALHCKVISHKVHKKSRR